MFSDNERDLLLEDNRRASYSDEMNFEQQVQEFLKEHEEDNDHYQYHQQQQQLDEVQLTYLQSNDDVDRNDGDFDHDMVNDDDNELTRNDDDLLLEMENCIN